MHEMTHDTKEKNINLSNTHFTWKHICCVSYRTIELIKILQSDKLKTELEMLRGKYHQANDEITSLRMNLEDSRGNADRLHRESELVVHNVNTWVKEQK